MLPYIYKGYINFRKSSKYLVPELDVGIYSSCIYNLKLFDRVLLFANVSKSTRKSAPRHKTLLSSSRPT